MGSAVDETCGRGVAVKGVAMIVAALKNQRGKKRRWSHAGIDIELVLSVKEVFAVCDKVGRAPRYRGDRDVG